jgi:DNA-binding MarR family transcriptional regulator
MNNTVEIVKEWLDYQVINPNATIEDFCNNFLFKSKKSKNLITDLNCKSENQLVFGLTKTINRLSKLWMYFTLNAVKSIGLTSFDEFTFLYTINESKFLKKKDLIYMHYLEISSGLLVIDRLIKKGFLAEKTDEDDKRSKLVSLTPKGKQALEKCDLELGKVANELYGEMPKEQMEFCTQYLMPIENANGMKWNEIKNL